MTTLNPKSHAELYGASKNRTCPQTAIPLTDPHIPYASIRFDIGSVHTYTYMYIIKLIVLIVFTIKTRPTMQNRNSNRPNQGIQRSRGTDSEWQIVIIHATPNARSPTGRSRVNVDSCVSGAD